MIPLRIHRALIVLFAVSAFIGLLFAYPMLVLFGLSTLKLR